MSKSSKKCIHNIEKFRLNSSTSFTGLKYQTELIPNSKQSRGCNTHFQFNLDNSFNHDDQQHISKSTFTQKNKSYIKPTLQQLGKENIKRPNNNGSRKSPYEFFQQQIELSNLKRAKKELENHHTEEIALKEEHINTLFKLKEQNCMNLEEMSKLNHLINQFEGQLHRVNQEKEKSEISLKEAMEKISCLKDQHPLELQAKHHRHQIDQYQRIIESNKCKLAKYEQQLKSLSQAVEIGNQERQKLKENLLTVQSHQDSQQQYQLRLNEYIVKVNEAQNRANELQIKYSRIQKENDDSKQAKEEATIQIQQLLHQIQQQKQFYYQEENTLLSKIKSLEGQKRRADIERTTFWNEKEMLFTRLKKEKDAEIDRLNLQLEKSVFELQEKTKELTYLQADRQSDASKLILQIESMELTLKKEKVASQQILQKCQSQLKAKKTQIQQMTSQLLDHVEVIRLLQTKLSQQSEQREASTQEIRVQHERLIDDKSKEIESLRRENEARQESMLRYSHEMQSIKLEFRSILEERDVTMRQYECEAEEKDQRINQLEEYLKSKQIQFEKQFAQLHNTIQCNQTRLNNSYKVELERRDTIISITEKALLQSQIEIASLKSNLQAALASSQELKEQSTQMTRLFTQTKVDISSMRQSFIDENSSKQQQLTKMIQRNQFLESELNKVNNLGNILKERSQYLEEKSQHLEEQCSRLKNAVYQEQLKQRQLAAELENSKSANAKLSDQKILLNQLRQNEHSEFNTIRQTMIYEAVQGNIAKLEALHNSQIQLLRSQVAVLKSHQNTLHEDLNKNQKEVSTLESENKKLESLLANQIHSQSDLKIRYKSKEQQVGSQKRDLVLKEEEIRLINLKANELNCKIESLQLQLVTEKQVIGSLRQENSMLKQVQESLRFQQQTKSSECAHYQIERKQLEKTIEVKTNELTGEFKRRTQLEQTVRHLNEQIINYQVKITEMDKTQIESRKIIESKSLQIDKFRWTLETEKQQRIQFEKHVQEILQSKAKKEQQQNIKSTSQISNLRKNLQNCLKEYENLRVTQETASNRLLTIKSQRDTKLVELQEAKMKIRVLESENRSIQTIMTEQLDKRKRLIEELVKEKNNAVGEMERSKISKY